jgi:hypothetical protein
MPFNVAAVLFGVDSVSIVTYAVALAEAAHEYLSEFICLVPVPLADPTAAKLLRVAIKDHQAALSAHHVHILPVSCDLFPNSSAACHVSNLLSCCAGKLPRTASLVFLAPVWRFDPVCLAHMLFAHASTAADVITGSRFPTRRQRRIAAGTTAAAAGFSACPFLLHLREAALATASSCLLTRKLSDPACGLRLWTHAAFENVVKAATPASTPASAPPARQRSPKGDTQDAPGFGFGYSGHFPLWSVITARRQGLAVAEVPVVECWGVVDRVKRQRMPISAAVAVAVAAADDCRDPVTDVAPDADSFSSTASASFVQPSLLAPQSSAATFLTLLSLWLRS